jgi:hypothetical protein
MGARAYLYRDLMTLPGRSRTIVVEPLRTPAQRPAPAPAPAPPPRRPDRPRQPEPAPARR